MQRLVHMLIGSKKEYQTHGEMLSVNLEIQFICIVSSLIYSCHLFYFKS